MLPILLGVTFITFALLYIAPGHPLASSLELSHGAGDIEAKSRALGLDKPFLIQYLNWLKSLVKGDLGWSYHSGRPVSHMILERLPATLLLMGSSLVLSLFLAISLAFLSAMYPWLGRLLELLTLTGVSVPIFFLCTLAIYVFSFRLGLLPSGGIMTIGQSFSLRDLLKHLLLPTSLLTIINSCEIYRYTMASLSQVLEEDYVMVHRAKGIPEAVVILHALRNALIPGVTFLGLALPSLVAGAAVVEAAFSWPGIGSLFMTAIYQRDYPLLLGITLVTTWFTLLGSLIADICYKKLDPRVRLEES